MNPDREFADQLGQWLSEGPADAPDRVLDAILASYGSIPQRRAGRSILTWTRPTLGGGGRLLASATFVAVVLVGAFALFDRPSSNVGGPTSPSPSPSPSASTVPSAAPGGIDTSAWPSFTSARYGLTVRYPAGWQAARAEAPWTTTLAFPTPSDARPAKAPVLDTFTSPDGPVFGAASQPLPSGMSSDAWLAAHEAAGLAMDRQLVCWPAPADMARTTVGGVPGWVSNGCGSTEVIAFTGGRVYVFTSEIDPTFNRPTFDAFLSTVTFAPSSADDTTEPRVPSAPPPS